MAGPQSQLKDQWRSEDKTKDHKPVISSSTASIAARPRGRSPTVTSSRRDFRPSPPYSRKRSRSHQSRHDSRERKTTRRRSRSPVPDDGLHRPARGRPRSPSPFSRPRHSANKPRHPRNRLRSPRRNVFDQPDKQGRQRSPTNSRRVFAREISPDQHPQRAAPRTSRRGSPDSYIPSGRKKSRSPTATTSWQTTRRRSLTPPRYNRTRRDYTPEHFHPKHRHSKTAATRDRPQGSRELDTYKSSSRSYRSPSPRSRPSIRSRGSRSPQRRRRSRSWTRSRSPRGRRPRRYSRDHEDMRPSYPPHGSRGGSRPPVDPHGYNGSPPYAPPPPPIAHHGHSPYGHSRGWPSHSPYPSHPGSPYPPPPYRQGSYPPPPSPGYYPPPPPQYYGASPPYPPQAYPPHLERRNTSDQRSPPDARASSRESSSKRRGLYSNLSWTPSTGSRGGHQAPPARKGAKDKDRPDKDEDDDDPFRPSKDFRAEDESKKIEVKRTVPTKAELEADSKFKFAFKAKSTSSTTNPISAFDKRPKKERRLVKRIKYPPTLPPEFVNSDSVYYRKPGNESVIGSGTYGKVFRAIHVYTGEKVALKKIRMEGERDGFPVTAIREVKLLQSLNHDNIVRLQEVMVEKNDCYMVFEYLSHDLTGLLNHPTFTLDSAHKKHLAKQLFDGLDYLHRRGVLHRDIKAANILISNTGELKLADFGLARFFAKRRQLDYTNRVITIWYRSPELLLGETQYGPAVDIWSAACVLVEIYTRRPIFPGDGGEINQLDKIYEVLGTPTRSEWPGIVEMAWFELLRPAERKQSVFEEKYKNRVDAGCFDLLAQMFRYDPAKRPSAQQVLEHSFFTTDDPPPKRALELKDLEGDWHEFESKALRKERERRDKRKASREDEEQRRRKRGIESSTVEDGTGAGSDDADSKRPKLEEQVEEASTSASAAFAIPEAVFENGQAVQSEPANGQVDAGPASGDDGSVDMDVGGE